MVSGLHPLSAVELLALGIDLVVFAARQVPIPPGKIDAVLLVDDLED